MTSERDVSTAAGYRRQDCRPSPLARERGASYRATPDASPSPSPREEGLDDASDASGADGTPNPDLLDEAVSSLVELDLDPLDDATIREELVRVQQAIRRLGAFRARAAGVLESRGLRAAGPGREQQALQTQRRKLARDLRLQPSEAKRDGETGRRLAELPAAQAASNAGDLPVEHARVLTDTLRHLSAEVRRRVEDDLLEAARRLDAREFGRTCRRILAQQDMEAAQAAQDRRNARRSLRMTQTADGMLALHGQGSGVGAEFVQSAMHAFRRPDAPGEHRNPEQRSWDALVEVCRVALDAAKAPANRGVRPHVLVCVDEETIRRDTGVAETAWSGPLPWSEIRPLLADSSISRLVIDPNGLPLEAGEAVRSVPTGLWKALQLRDRVCAGDGCDIPAAWCQVMHLDVPYRLQGRLTLDTAAPGCTFHHRMLDHHGWQVTWINGKPVIHHPDRPPERPPDRAPAARSPDRPPGRAPGQQADRPPDRPPPD
jgi:hypothetical protein